MTVRKIWLLDRYLIRAKLKGLCSNKRKMTSNKIFTSILKCKSSDSQGNFKENLKGGCSSEKQIEKFFCVIIICLTGPCAPWLRLGVLLSLCYDFELDK